MHLSRRRSSAACQIALEAAIAGLTGPKVELEPHTFFLLFLPPLLFLDGWRIPKELLFRDKSTILILSLGEHGVRVNTICPTFIETPMTKDFLADQAFRDFVLSKIRLGRLGTVEDVAAAALYLASDAASLMTGSALMLDGGWTAG